MQGQNAYISNAIEAIDRCAIKPSNFKVASNRPFTGHIASYDSTKKTIVLKIDDGFQCMMRTYFDQQKYDITFETIRLTFQLQHEALKYMKQHGLFEILINNPEYKVFRNEHQGCNSVEKTHLNHEQNLAVNSILSLKDSVPFLLFGPPGMF